MIVTLPFAICPDVLVDGVTYQSSHGCSGTSVVATASYASKLIKRSRWFHNYNPWQVNDWPSCPQHDRSDKGCCLKQNSSSQSGHSGAKEELILLLLSVGWPSQALENGETSLSSRWYPEAMGANMVNTMMEALVPELENLKKVKVAILSNLATEVWWRQLVVLPQS